MPPEPRPAPVAYKVLSGRPGHLATRLLDRARHVLAVDHGVDMEQIVGLAAFRLCMTDIKRPDQLVLVCAVERCIGHQAHFGRQLHALQCLGHLRSEEHTSELQSLMRISYAVFCLKKKNSEQHKMSNIHHNT